MRAIILAGGKGTRLVPYTRIIPKALMPIAGFPVTEILIRQLKHYGFKKITMAVGYLSEQITDYFGDGKNWGVKIDYSCEDKPLGTAGPLRTIRFNEQNELVLNSDIPTHFNFLEFMNYHKRMKATVTVGVRQEEQRIAFGIIENDLSNRVISYVEKPKLSLKISMGIYAISYSSLRYLSVNRKYDMPEFINKLISKNERVFAYEANNYWAEIGTHGEYMKAQKEFMKKRGGLLR